MIECLSYIYKETKPIGSRMCAILYNKSKILSIGWSTPVTHVNIFKKNIKVPAVHAEIEAIKKVIYSKKSYSRKKIKADLIVFKQNTRGEFTNSKPCKHCIEFIGSNMVTNFMRIRTITYCENGVFKHDKLNSIHNDHITYGWSKYYKR